MAPSCRTVRRACTGLPRGGDRRRRPWDEGPAIGGAGRAMQARREEAAPGPRVTPAANRDRSVAGTQLPPFFGPRSRLAPQSASVALWTTKHGAHIAFAKE